jgi:hypothetical protein
MFERTIKVELIDGRIFPNVISGEDEIALIKMVGTAVSSMVAYGYMHGEDGSLVAYPASQIRRVSCEDIPYVGDKIPY